MIYIFNVITIKIPKKFLFFPKVECHPKIHIKTQGVLKSQNNFENKIKTGGLILPDFKLCYKTIILRTVRYKHKDRQINQWNRILRPEINPYKQVQMIFNK